MTKYQHQKGNTHAEIKHQFNHEQGVKITYVLQGQFAADDLVSLYIGFANLILIPGDGNISKPIAKRDFPS